MRVFTRQFYFLLTLFPCSFLLAAEEAVPLSVNRQTELGYILTRMIDPLLSKQPSVVQDALNGWRFMQQATFEAIMSEIDTLAGIDRDSIWAWFPAMWTKTKIVDTFKNEINELRYGIRNGMSLELKESVASLRALLDEDTRFRPGLETAALAYAHTPTPKGVLTRGVITLSEKS